MKKQAINLPEQVIELMKQLSINDRRTINTTYLLAVEEYLKSRGVKIGLTAELVPQISKNTFSTDGIKAPEVVIQKLSSGTITEPANVPSVTKPEAKKPAQHSADNPKPLKQWKVNVQAKQEKAKQDKQVVKEVEPTPQPEPQEQAEEEIF